jgi:YbbR domain-containing protein
VRWLFHNLRYKLLALGVALLLWSVSHTTTSIERGFDIPVAIHGLPEDLVVTSQSSDAVNIRVRASRAALRALSAEAIDYPVDLGGARAGLAEIEVDTTRIDLPRGVEIVSRSPLNLDFTLERRGTKSVRVRPDLEGVPATGYKLGEVSVEPARVRITGARSEVLRLSEVLTETIDVTGAQAPIERKVRVSLRGRNVWIDDGGDITVRVDVAPEEPPAEEKTG